MDDQTIKLLTCPICKNLTEDPLECLSCSQIYCKPCNPTFCKTCNKSSEFQHSKVARKIIMNVEVNCPYCNQKFKKGDLDEIHYKVCDKYKIKCIDSNCNFESTKNNFIEHILSTHSNEFLDIFTIDIDEIKKDLQHVLSPRSVKKLKINNKCSSDLTNVHNKLYLQWCNSSSKFVKTYKGKHLYSTINSFNNATIKIKFSNCKNYNYCIVGFSKCKYLNGTKYLGGETGKGDWGLAGNGSIGEEGTWSKTNVSNNTKYTTEIITLNFFNGEISYSIQGKENNNYRYNLSVKEVYLTVGLYFEGDTVEILNN